MSGSVFPGGLGLVQIPQRELIAELWRALKILPAHSAVREDKVGISTSPSQSRAVGNFPNLNLFTSTF